MKGFTKILQKPSVRVYMDHLAVFAIRPPPEELKDLEMPPDEQDDSPVLQGVINLNLPSSRYVDKINVVFEGVAVINDGYCTKPEKFTTIHKELMLNISENLEAGDHLFNFTFIIPSSTATYQRSKFGTVDHSIVAHVKFDQPCSTRFSLFSSISSEPTAIFLNPAHTANGMPPLLSQHREHFYPELGALAISLNSPHMTVSTLMALEVDLASVPKDTRIIRVSSAISQQFEVHHPDGRIVKPPVVKHRLTPVYFDEQSKVWDDRVNEKVPLCVLTAGEGFKYHKYLRFPDDNHIRPSTVPGSKAPIKVSSLLSVELHFKTSSDDEAQVLELSKPIIIAPCCQALVQESELLPLYSADKPAMKAHPVSLFEADRPDKCLCFMSAKEVADGLGFMNYMDELEKNQQFIPRACKSAAYSRASSFEEESREVAG